VVGWAQREKNLPCGKKKEGAGGSTKKKTTINGAPDVDALQGERERWCRGRSPSWRRGGEGILKRSSAKISFESRSGLSRGRGSPG